MSKDHFVIATSGWQGDGWRLDSIHETRAAAEARAAEIRSPDARDANYIVAVISTSRNEWPGDEPHVVILDTSRVKVREPHLKARRCRVNAHAFVRGE